MRPVFELADRFVDERIALNPVLATALGVPGHDHEWGESLSLDGIDASLELIRSYRPRFEEHLDHPDFHQALGAQVAVASMAEEAEAHEAGDHFRDLRHLGSPFHRLRSIFDLMDKTTAEGWANIVSRLSTIDRPFAAYRRRLETGIDRGIVVARRQAASIAEQARDLAGEESAYLELAGEASAAGHASEELAAGIDHARAAASEFGEWLEGHYLAAASEADAVGEETYARFSDRLVGMSVDPDKEYQWGWEEFGRLHDEMEEIGHRIVPGGSFAEVKEHLETDPEGLVGSPAELVEFVDALLTEAVEDLSGKHFFVPDEIRPLTVRIAPPGGPLGVYYTGPSEDFSRPGGVWYSIGDQKVFPLYQHVSTAYHEGFPGHHLQIGTKLYRRDDLTRVQRALTFYPGYSEGWAMYAEVLMGELGYLEDPRHHFGMLAKQMYRVSRMVVDLGLHLGKPIAGSSPIDPGESWSFSNAVEFMRVYGFRTPAQAEAEVLRYLGWPGQAPAYKLGERAILGIRGDARRRQGAGFTLEDFHATLLDHGPMRLDTLAEVAART